MADQSSKESEKAKAAGGEMSVREAGKKGGDTVRERYGSGFYETIGRKGGQATRERHGAQFYETIGQKGGRVVKDKYGSDFYEEIGHKGGQKVKALIAEAKKNQADEAERVANAAKPGASKNAKTEPKA
ncbi:MAG: general stress protein B [Candidatus Eremiobacteraeota bacterium]|nr:general stress protein B [Candidatus Eremiobacteraeota bacterium]